MQTSLNTDLCWEVKTLTQQPFYPPAGGQQPDDEPDLSFYRRATRELHSICQLSVSEEWITWDIVGAGRESPVY